MASASLELFVLAALCGEELLVRDRGRVRVRVGVGVRVRVRVGVRVSGGGW